MIFLLLLKFFTKFSKCSDESDFEDVKSQKRVENTKNIIFESEKSDQDLKDGITKTKIKIVDLNTESQQQKSLNFLLNALEMQQRSDNLPEDENNEPLDLSISHRTENNPFNTSGAYFSDKTKCLNLLATSNPVKCIKTSLTASKLFTCSVIEGKMDDEQPSTSKAFESRTTKRHMTCTNEPLVPEKKQKISEKAVEVSASTVSTKIFKIDSLKTVAITGCRKRKQTKPKKLFKSLDCISVETGKEKTGEEKTGEEKTGEEESIKSGEEKSIKSGEEKTGEEESGEEESSEEVKTKNTLKFVETKEAVVQTSSAFLTLQFISEQFSELQRSSKLTKELFKNQFITFVKRLDPEKKICFPIAQRCDMYFDQKENINLIEVKEFKTKIEIDDIENQRPKNGKICILCKRIAQKVSDYIDCIFFIPKVVQSYQQFNLLDESKERIITSESEEYCLVLFTLRFSKNTINKKKYLDFTEFISVDEWTRPCYFAINHRHGRNPLKKYILVFHHGQAALLKCYKSKFSGSIYTIHKLTEENIKLLKD